MNDKKLIWWGMFVGSTLGGFVPSLWHASMLSLWGFVFSAIGGIVGIWVGWRISHGG
jgi:hypothetical protein